MFARALTRALLVAPLATRVQAAPKARSALQRHERASGSDIARRATWNGLALQGRSLCTPAAPHKPESQAAPLDEAQAEASAEVVYPKGVVPRPPPSEYKLAAESVKGKVFLPNEAIDTIRKLKRERKIDETIEVAIDLRLDVRKADQLLRANFDLPHSHGRERVRVIAFCEPELVNATRAAGAQVAGLDDVIALIKSKKLKLHKTDKVIATPGVIRKVQKEISKILGPKGLLPSLKFGTVVENPAEEVERFKTRNVQLRTGRSPVVHVGIAKISFPDDVILENLRATMLALLTNKPPGSRGKYIRSVFLGATMTPSVELDLAYADPSSALFMRTERLSKN